jgi:hypothetical protein
LSSGFKNVILLIALGAIALDGCTPSEHGASQQIETEAVCHGMVNVFAHADEVEHLKELGAYYTSFIEETGLDSDCMTLVSYRVGANTIDIYGVLKGKQGSMMVLTAPVVLQNGVHKLDFGSHQAFYKGVFNKIGFAPPEVFIDTDASHPMAIYADTPRYPGVIPIVIDCLRFRPLLFGHFCGSDELPVLEWLIPNQSDEYRTQYPRLSISNAHLGECRIPFVEGHPVLDEVPDHIKEHLGMAGTD